MTDAEKLEAIRRRINSWSKTEHAYWDIIAILDAPNRDVPRDPPLLL